jgi:glycosyltransferase involved in cell wall biosynthesis
MNEPRTRVLVIAMANSIHTARWLSQFRDQKIDIVLFPSTPSRSLHPLIADLLNNDFEMKLEIAPLMKRLAYPLGILDLIFKNLLRSFLLKKLMLHENKFVVIHAMELQHAGYLLLKSRAAIPSLSRVIVSNWGSDIFWFQRFPRHRRKLESLMGIATHYSCECHRDVDLAKELGFKGSHFPVRPNAGAFSQETFTSAMQAPLPSSRKLVMIKGYTGFVGRADIALQACWNAAENLKNFEIVLYSSDMKSRRIARRLSRTQGLSITIYKKHQLSHDAMLNLFRQARIYIGISDSDGISTSLLDAISSGCYPIQTTTSCANEWVVDGITGSLVDVKNVHGISIAVQTALADDNLVDNAAMMNISNAQRQLSGDSIHGDLTQFYNLN